MPGKVILRLPAFFLLSICLCVHPGKSPEAPFAIFQTADNFFNSDHPTAITDSLALSGFEEVIRQLNKLPGKAYDSLLFQSYLKKGILLDVLNKNAEAKDAYLNAARLPLQNKSLSDSLLFLPYVYAGTNFFNLNNFDSSNFFLVKAETLVKRYPQLQDVARLYNTLGALHYVNGNYLQSKNYFSRALSFIKNKQPYDRVFALGLQANIAASFYKLGLYNASLAIYGEITKEKIQAVYIYNGIWMNMGKAFISTKRYREAINCFHKVNAAAMPGVFNELGRCYYEWQQPDSARVFLNKIDTADKTGNVNILDIGINCLYQADLLTDTKQYADALQQLQKAITIFAGNFRNRDIFANPAGFSGSYTYYRLFDALYKKASVFQEMSKTTGEERYLVASLDAYKTAITLLSFVEKSYDTDDAKLFLKKKSENVYSEALLICLRLHAQHPNKDYLEQGFMISERNKASVMAANLRQNTGNAFHGIDPSFVQAEKNIKFALARLDVKSEQTTDSKELEQLAAEKTRYQIELSGLQKNMEQNSVYYQLKYEEDFQQASEINKKLNDKQVLFSFYTTGNKLHIFSVTSKGFAYRKVENLKNLQKAITEWLNALHSAGDGRKFSPGTSGQQLYNQLIRPMQQMVPAADEWIIIPEGQLSLLPFESLPIANTDQLLLETTTISYQLSARFLLHTERQTATATMPAVLSLAPFSHNGARYNATGFEFINQLPASAAEIAHLKGASYSDEKATKAIFLQQAEKYQLIHLATHAIGNVENPAASFIAFYPSNKTAQDNCLYLEEIYGLKLDNCKLVVISACETGKGALVNNEGIISLGRAFAYAGCGASINSLWKADDKATATILQQFHAYLEQGLTKSKALQRAKLDYLKSDALYKNPAYWSNLVLSGDTAPIVRKERGYFLPTTAAVLLILITGMATRSIRKKSRRFSQLPVLHQ